MQMCVYKKTRFVKNRVWFVQSSLTGNSLECFVPFLPRSNPYGFFDWDDEKLAVSNLARLGRAYDCIHNLGDKIVTDNSFKFDLG